MLSVPKPPHMNGASDFTIASTTLDSRSKSLPTDRWSYKLGVGSGYGLDVLIASTDMEPNESEMSLVIPYADGKRRDGVGDLLCVGGINIERHIANPIVLFDHGKQVTIPIGVCEDPKTREYCNWIDVTTKSAKLKCFFYQGGATKVAGLDGIAVLKDKQYDHSVFCSQLFDLAAKRFIRGGSIGYQVIKASQLPPDYTSGIPQGLSLEQVLMLEGSLVVMPANMDTVGKSFDITREILCMPSVCGKPLSPYLVKSLTGFAKPQTKVVSGWEGKAVKKDVNHPPSQFVGDLGWLQDEAKEKEHKGDIVLQPVPLNDDLSKTDIPPAKWKPGAGAVKGGVGDKVATLRKKYRGASVKRGIKRGIIAKLENPQVEDTNLPANKGAEKKPAQPKKQEKKDSSKNKKAEKKPASKKEESKKELPNKGEKGLALSANTELNGGALRGGPSSSLPEKKSCCSNCKDGKPCCSGKKDLRKKYRSLKSLRRKVKSSRAGASVLHVRNKDIDEARKLAGSKGCGFNALNSDGAVTKIKLSGDDKAMDEVAKAFGISVRRKNLDVKTKNAAIVNGRELISVVNVDAKLRETADQILDWLRRGRTLKEALDKYQSQVPPEQWEELFRLVEGTGQQVRAKKSLTSDNKNLDKEHKSMADIDTDLPGGEEQGELEKYSAQVLRRLHQDAMLLMEQYDEMLEMLEHGEITDTVVNKLETLAGELDEYEALFQKHHPNAKPLEGAGSGGPGVEIDIEAEEPEEGEEEEKDMPESDAKKEGMDGGNEEEEIAPEEKGEKTKDKGKTKATPDEKEAQPVEADSEEEELPTPEEAVKGMQTKDLRNHLVKALRKVYKKTANTGGSGASSCTKCGANPCVCKKGKSRNLGIGDSDGHEPGAQAVLQEQGDNPVVDPKKRDKVEDSVAAIGSKGMEDESMDMEDKSYDSEHDNTADEGIEGSHKPGFEAFHTKRLDPHETGHVMEAGKFLDGISKKMHLDGDDPHLLYHFHKLLEPMGKIPDDSQMNPIQHEFDNEFSDGGMPAGVKGYDSVHDNTSEVGIADGHKPGFEFAKEKAYDGKQDNTATLGVEGSHGPGFEEFGHTVGESFPEMNEIDDSFHVTKKKKGVDPDGMDELDAMANVQSPSGPNAADMPHSFMHHRKNIGNASSWMKKLCSFPHDYGETKRQEAAMHAKCLMDAHKSMGHLMEQPMPGAVPGMEGMDVAANVEDPSSPNAVDAPPPGDGPGTEPNHAVEPAPGQMGQKSAVAAEEQKKKGVGKGGGAKKDPCKGKDPVKGCKNGQREDEVCCRAKDSDKGNQHINPSTHAKKEAVKTGKKSVNEELVRQQFLQTNEQVANLTKAVQVLQSRLRNASVVNESMQRN